MERTWKICDSAAVLLSRGKTIYVCILYQLLNYKFPSQRVFIMGRVLVMICISCTL